MRLACLFLALEAADLLTTWLVCRGHCLPHLEGNPIAAFVMARWGWAGLTVAKAASAGLPLIILTLVRRTSPRHARGGLALACLILGLVCLHNACLIAFCR